MSLFMFGEIKEQTAYSTRISQVIIGVSELPGQLHVHLNVRTGFSCTNDWSKKQNLSGSNIVLQQGDDTFGNSLN